MKQAYLIIAHQNDITFRTLVSMLDDENNDIFIHMDKKNKTYKKEEFEKIVTKSNIYHTKRTNVKWGGYSQINAELVLLRCATSIGHYNHYHLLSGQDLPIQKQETIQEFFIRNSDKEFVGFDNEAFEYGDRIYYRYIFQELTGRNGKLRRIDNELLKIQKTLNIRRNQNIRFQKGVNWFSITDDFARYVVDKEKWVKKVFKQSYCADEVFLQTILLNSDYINNLYYSVFDDSDISTMRKIDWKRGKPYTFRYSDLAELENSDLMFARKFDCAVDGQVIRGIYELYKS